MQPVYLVLPATAHRLQAKFLSRNATNALLAMEAYQLRILHLPLPAVQSAQLVRIKQLQALVNAPLALLDIQPLRQEVLLPHLVVSALLAILAVYQLQTLLDVLHALLARTNHQQAQLHAPRALSATPHLLLERHCLVIAFAPLVIPKETEESVLHVLWENIRLILALVLAQIALPAKQPLEPEELSARNALFVLLATLGLAVLHALLARINQQQAQLLAHLVLLEPTVTQLVWL
jgi:hypothetical protein